MADLIKAKLVKYFRSPLFYIAAAVSLISGIYGGVYFSHFSDEPCDVLNCSADDMWMITAMWAEIVLVAMCAGREFSDGTVRSKIIAGHSKARVFISEVLTAAIVTVIIYILNIVPTAIGGGYFFGSIPALSAANWFIDVFLAFEFMSIMAAAVTYLLSKRAAAVVAAFGLHFVLYVIFGFTNGYYYSIGEPQIVTASFCNVLEDGTVEEVEEEVVNRYYTEGLPKALIKAEHALNPIGGFEDAIYFGYIPDKTKVEDYVLEQERNMDRDLKLNVVKMLVYCFALTFGGAYLFGKKDLK